MKIATIESLHADAGTRNFDFLKRPCPLSRAKASFGRRDDRPYLMSAHFCAVVPNVRIMETDPDTVPWHDDLVTVKPDIKDGYISLPTGPGWGTEINEDTVRAHPPRQR